VIALALVLLAQSQNVPQLERAVLFARICQGGADFAIAALPAPPHQEEAKSFADRWCRNEMTVWREELESGRPWSKLACTRGVSIVLSHYGLGREVDPSRTFSDRANEMIKHCIADATARGRLPKVELEALVSPLSCFRGDGGSILQITRHVEGASYLRVYSKGAWGEEKLSGIDDLRNRAKVPCPREPKR